MDWSKFEVIVALATAFLAAGVFYALRLLDQILAELKRIRESSSEISFYTKHPSEKPDGAGDLPFSRD